MQISTAVSAQHVPHVRQPEVKEAGPDRDGDQDDKGASALKSMVSAGVGKALDVTA